MDWRILVTTVGIMCGSAIALAQGDAPVPGGVTKHGNELAGVTERYLRERFGEIEDENAWPLLAETLPILFEYRMKREGPEEEWLFTDFLLNWAPERRGYDGDAEETRAWTLHVMDELERAGFFEELGRLTTRFRAIYPAQEGPMLKWMIPELGLIRRAHSACLARMHLAAGRDDWQALLDSFEQSLMLGRMSWSIPLVPVVGWHIAGEAVQHIVWHVMERKPEPVHLGAILEAMERQKLPGPHTVRVQFDRLQHLDTIEDFYGEADEEWDAAMVERELNVPAGLPGTAALASRREAIEFAEQRFERLVAIADLPAWEAIAEIRAFWSEEIPSRQRIAGILGGPGSGEFIQRQTAEAKWHGARLILAIELFKAQHERYPAQLADLVPDFIAELPPDPFSGGAFGYRLLKDGEDPHGRAYLLYSAGRDGKDNGGRAPEGSAMQAVNNARAAIGADFIISHPRE